MKLIKRLIVIVLVIIFSMPNDIVAANRVICDVDVSSENSAVITLTWTEESEVNIRITSWKLTSDDMLVVYYDYGDRIPEGWNSKAISGDDYQFPMKVILEEQGNDTEPFTDMPEDEETKYSLLNLYSRSIINGYPDGSFKEENNVTRTEFAKMITTTAGYEILEDMSSDFSDVSNDFWGKNYIMTLANKGIINGYPGGTFSPNGSITLGEVLAVINRSFTFYEDYSVYSYELDDHWSNENFKLLVEKDIVRETDDFYIDYNGNAKATRKDCVILLSRVLEKLYKIK